MRRDDEQRKKRQLKASKKCGKILWEKLDLDRLPIINRPSIKQWSCSAFSTKTAIFTERLSAVLPS